MGDESALEARLERAHTVIGDLLRSLGEIDLLPERQQVAAREAVAFREQHVIERGVSRLVERELSQVSRALDVPGDLPEDIKRQVIRDGWAPPIWRLLERAAELRAEVDRLTADLDKQIAARANSLAAVRAALPPGDEQVPVAERVAQLVREHGEMVAEMMKSADPEDIADAAASLVDPRAVPAPERGAVEFIDVVFDGPPGPASGGFVEIEDHRGHSIKLGEWLDRGDGTWALRIPMQPPTAEVGEVMAAAGALSALTAVVATSGMDWRRSPCLAWVYGVLVGHDRDVLEDLQMVFHWPDGTVDEIDRHRRALLAARGA